MVVHSKLRTWLTILGIVIGVASVIAIVSLGEGMEQSIGQQMTQLGTDILTITPGYSRGLADFGARGRFANAQGGTGGVATEDPTLGKSDYQVLRGMAEFELIDTNIRGNVKVSYFDKSGTLTLIGVDQKIWAQITTEQISKGRLLNSADNNVVVIGDGLSKNYFSKPLEINQMFTIEDRSFRVIGILEGNSRNIYMPLSMAYQVLDDKEINIYDSIVVKVKNEEKIDETIEKIESRLMLSRHVTDKNKDFTISSNKAMQETRSEMLSSMKIFLTAIAAVSLIVGAVGIANTMFTSVLEKTKDIGIMKAIGARNKDILFIFLFNAALIGFAGGIIGAFFGVLTSSALPDLISGNIGNMGNMLMRGGTVVTPEIIFIALGISVTVGILAGIIPAYQASRLKPVDALRYE